MNFASHQSWDVHWEPLYSEGTVLLGLLPVSSYQSCESLADPMAFACHLSRDWRMQSAAALVRTIYYVPTVGTGQIPGCQAKRPTEPKHITAERDTSIHPVSDSKSTVIIWESFYSCTVPESSRALSFVKIKLIQPSLGPAHLSSHALACPRLICHLPIMGTRKHGNDNCYSHRETLLGSLAYSGKPYQSLVTPCQFWPPRVRADGYQKKNK